MPYYHVTPTINIPRIFEQGLLPQRGDRALLMNEEEDAIFLFPSRADVDNALMNWLGDEFEEDEPLTLLEIELPPNVQVVPSTVEYEVMVFDPIPPKYIKDLGAV